MKILYLLSQRPDSTGSGIYLQAMLKEGAKWGCQNVLLAGLPKGDILHLTGLRPEEAHYVRFHCGDLSFEIVGMSDVMPYPSMAGKAGRVACFTCEWLEAIRSNKALHGIALNCRAPNELCVRRI